MYLISVLLLMLCLGLTITVSGISIIHFIDAISLLITILIVLPILISSGLARDFNNAFSLSIKRNKECSRLELLRAIESVNLTIRALWAAGIFNSVFAITDIMAKSEGQQLIRYISVALITLVYSSFLVILLLPVKYRLKVRLHELSENSGKCIGETE